MVYHIPRFNMVFVCKIWDGLLLFYSRYFQVYRQVARTLDFSLGLRQEFM